MTGVLAGLRVLDLSTGPAGQMAAMLLGDHGADVVRIEAPSAISSQDRVADRVWSRGKTRAFFDLSDAADHRAFVDLARHADVLVESFAPGATKSLGIDYEALNAVNPRLIYASITPYGRGTADENRPGDDALVAARTGLQFEIKGWRQGQLNHMLGRPGPLEDVDIPYEDQMPPDREGPIYNASRWPNLGAFFAISTAISAALHAREVTGRGQWVETTLLQGALICCVCAYQRAENPDAEGFDAWIMMAHASKGHYQCKDGVWIQNWVPNPRFVISASEGDRLDSSPDLRAQNDPDRYGTGPEELLVMQHYQPIFKERIKKFTAKEWVDAAAKADMTIQAVRSIEDSLNDPLFLEEGCVVEVDDPELGPIRQVGVVCGFEKTPARVKGPAARPGEHTDAVKAEAAALREEPAVPAKPGKALSSPLAGVKVIDLGLAIAGPYGTQLLSDLGAQVIKINALYDHFWHRTHIAYTSNRNKRSIALNLKDSRAKQILLDLVKDADIVHSNMRYDAMERLGVDYESLKAINPKLIFCHTRCFEDGPRKTLPGNDQMGAALAGVQWEDGGMNRGGRPIWAGTSMGDTGNGFLSAIAVIQALYHRDRTGEGQMVDTSIVNACLLNTSYAYAFPDGRGPDRPALDKMMLGFSAGRRLYQTAEGWICLAVGNDEEWSALLNVLDLARYQDAGVRAADEAGLAEALEAAFKSKPASEWFEAIDAAGVPIEIVDDRFGPRLHDDPEMKKRGWVTSVQHKLVGKLDQIGLAFDFSETPGAITRAPLIVGECTREILRELGYSEPQIDDLVAANVVSDQPIPASLRGAA